MDREFLVEMCELGKDIERLKNATDGVYNIGIDFSTVLNKGNVWIYKNDGRCRGGYKVFLHIDLYKMEDIEKAKKEIEEIIMKEGYR